MRYRVPGLARMVPALCALALGACAAAPRTHGGDREVDAILARLESGTLQPES